MVSTMATIAAWPSVVAPFILKNWPQILTGVWGVGFAFVLYRAMIRWYREDAHEARLIAPSGDEGAVYDAMKSVKQPKRQERTKWVFTRALFWMPIAGYKLGAKIGRVLLYPVMLVMDREKSRAIKDALTHKVNRFAGIEPVHAPEHDMTVEPGLILKTKVPCSLCGEKVAAEVAHRCTAVEYRCRQCGGPMVPESCHRCTGERPPVANARRRTECNTCGEDVIADVIHKCPDRAEDKFCSDCDLTYAEGEESHPKRNCEDCSEQHCVEAGCA